VTTRVQHSSVPPPPPIEQRLAELHAQLREDMPAIVRVAIAVYDSQTDLLKTFTSSDVDKSPLGMHEAKLHTVPSLQQLAESRADRVINDLGALSDSTTVHSQAIAGSYASSYTRPLYDGSHLRGFLFYDANEKDYFSPITVHRLQVFSDLIALLLSSTFFPARMLRSAVHAATYVSHTRDPETGAHLERMARYARLIALELNDTHNLGAAFIEHLLTFAPLHDVGKVGVPDAVLLKSGPLTPEEFIVMRSHVDKGVQLIDELLESLGMRALPHVDMLRNIIQCHHEAWDGSGYPHGRIGEQIPIEARIVTVADVFDALTSDRPYKGPWTIRRTLDYVADQSGKLFDPQCVAALQRTLPAVEEVRAAFPDTRIHVREGYTSVL